MFDSIIIVFCKSFHILRYGLRSGIFDTQYDLQFDNYGSHSLNY